MKIPISGTQFNVGPYRCRYGQALGQHDEPTGEYCVWLWNGIYWQVLVRNCTDLESAKYSASQELCTDAEKAVLAKVKTKLRSTLTP